MNTYIDGGVTYEYVRLWDGTTDSEWATRQLCTQEWLRQPPAPKTPQPVPVRVLVRTEAA